ncbi:hypothetical protein B0H13DRAFT_1880245 [Mycena leptocephala]|nr:hypothetical protein B0H13DRAFT_1880245 [Mycena leptocephala]
MPLATQPPNFNPDIILLRSVRLGLVLDFGVRHIRASECTGPGLGWVGFGECSEAGPEYNYNYSFIRARGRRTPMGPASAFGGFRDVGFAIDSMYATLIERDRIESVLGVKSGVDGEQSGALHPGGPWCAAYLIFGDLAHKKHKELRMFRNARERTRAGSRVLDSQAEARCPTLIYSPPPPPRNRVGERASASVPPSYTYPLVLTAEPKPGRRGASSRLGEVQLSVGKISVSESASTHMVRDGNQPAAVPTTKQSGSGSGLCLTLPALNVNDSSSISKSRKEVLTLRVPRCRAGLGLKSKEK